MPCGGTRLCTQKPQVGPFGVQDGFLHSKVLATKSNGYSNRGFGPKDRRFGVDRLHNWAIGAAAATYAAFLTALVANRWQAWVAFGLGVRCLCPTGGPSSGDRFVASSGLCGRSEMRSSICPGVFSGSGRDCLGVSTTSSSVTTVVASPRASRFLYLSVWNKPRFGRQGIYGAHITLRFSDESSGQVIGELIYPRWAHLSKDLPEEATHVPRTVDLTGDAVKFQIDVAFRLVGNPSMYSVNDQSQHLANGYLDNSRKLGNKLMIVDAHVQGATSGRHIDKAFRFRLNPNTGRGDPTLVRID